MTSMSGGDYGRIRHTFWTDPDIKRVLNPEQKTLLLYFFSSPHRTLIGLYYCPLEYAASETGIELARVREWTAGALSRFVTYDEQTEEILVHRAGKHQVGEHLAEKDHQRKAVVKALQEAHSAKLVRAFLALYPHWNLNVSPPEGGEPVAEAPSEPLPSPSEAKAVSEQVQSITDTLPYGSGGQAADEVIDAEVEIVEDDGVCIPAADEPRPALSLVRSTEWSITPERIGSAPERLTTGAVIGAWAKRQPVDPDATERKKQGAVAKRLVERHSGRDIMLAFAGIETMFRFRDEPWDLFDLERLFSKAKAAAVNHPAVKEARADAELDAALDNLGLAS